MPHESSGLTDAHLHADALTETPHACPSHAIASDGADCQQPSATGLLFVNGTSPADWSRVADLSRTRPEIVPFFGLHPWFTPPTSEDPTREDENWLRELERLLCTFRAGVGEIGLDRRRAGLEPARQEEALRAQLTLARRYRRPVTLHVVAASDWLGHILKDENTDDSSLLLHGFSGSTQEARAYSKFGMYFSLSPRLLRWPLARQRQVLAAIPLQRLLLESDADHEEPQITAQRSEGDMPVPPSRVMALRSLYETVARLLAIPEPDLRQQVSLNAVRFLGEELKA